MTRKIKSLKFNEERFGKTLIRETKQLMRMYSRMYTGYDLNKFEKRKIIDQYLYFEIPIVKAHFEWIKNQCIKSMIKRKRVSNLIK